MTRLPQSNATLTQVRAGSLSAEWDRAEAPGAVKWSGSSDAYLVTRRERQRRGEESTVVVSRYLVVPSSLPVAFEEGDELAFTYAGAASTGIVGTVEARRFPSAGVVETTRLALEQT